MSLSSLIVEREIATIREIEEALARQVLYGGDFVTNLFEVSRIEEEALMPVVADSHGLATAPIGELPRAPSEALRLIAAEVVGERGFAPLEVGATLVIAVAEPLAVDVEQELTFALALPIEQRIAPRFRIKQALARDYGIPLDKRTARLITKVTHNGPRIASTFPPPMDSMPNLRAAPRPPSIAPPPAAPAPARAPVAGSTISGAVKVANAAAKGTFVRDKESAPLRPMRRRRGPLTADVAKAELEASVERDVIFDILFEFTRQFFDYTALFIVHGDIAEGRDAFGEGASREKVAKVGVPLDLENILATARSQKVSHRAMPKAEGLDPVLMKDLGRDGTTPCIVIPIVVRTRVVALLFGDGGPSGIDDEGVRQVDDLVAASAGAFERVIMRRKLKGAEAKPEHGVANAQRKAADSIPPPPTQVSAAQMPERLLLPGELPAFEELAPPIRDLLLSEPDPIGTSATAALIGADPVRQSDRPPPPNILQVRRPSGAPIPREEPENALARAQREEAERAAAIRSRRPASIPPPGRSVSAPPTATSPSGRPGPTRTKSQSLKRAEAPPLELSPRGSKPAPAVVAETVTSAATLAPRTTRDPSGGPWGMAGDGASGTSGTSVHPWARGAAASRKTPALGSPIDVGSLPPLPLVPSESPRASSPPPTRAARTTDVSPQVMFPPHDAQANARPRSVPPVVVATPRGEPLPRPATDLDATPLAPPVVDPDLQPTPLAPPVESGATEPVLALSQRKGAPPSSKGMRARKPMPASEQQISVAAHKPPSSARSERDDDLPSIIVDVSTEYGDLVDRVLAGPDEDAEAELLRAGGDAMLAIMAKFPGPITVDEEELEAATLPRVSECGPVIRLVASQRRTALPFVLSHLELSDPDARFWATFLLTELIYAEAVEPAALRAFDDDARVRRVARAALRALAEVHPAPVVEQLRELATSGPDPRRAEAMDVMGATREPLAVPVLVSFLGEHLDLLAAAARGALVQITQQDFGRDAAAWSAWWAENQGRHRIEWLIDALMHQQRSLRTSALEELRTHIKDNFGYYDDLPKRERQVAQAKYREWWESAGRTRFTRRTG